MTQNLWFPTLTRLTSTFSPLINLYVFTLFLFARKASCQVDAAYLTCKEPKTCGDGQNVSYPFFITDQQDPICGYPGFELSCNGGKPVLKLPDSNYIIHQFFYNNESLLVSNDAVFNADNTACNPPIQNVSLPIDRFLLVDNQTELFLFSGCNSTLPATLERYKVNCSSSSSTDQSRDNGTVLAMFEEDPNLGFASGNCINKVKAPVNLLQNESESYPIDVEGVLRRGFVLKWIASNCSVCEQSGGKCGFNYTSYQFKCYCPDRPHALRCNPPLQSPGHRNLKLLVGSVVGIGLLILISIFAIVIVTCYKRKKFVSRNSADLSSKSNLEGGSAYFGVPVFSHSELEEATNNFDSEKELGDGGFGIVYHGKLRDGREVAVKRLFEHNYKRVQQFMNEIKILTLLRHKNLVTLYGCTSRRSHELLLVYEYIPNGTVADHLHGEGANSSSLTWSIRMNIAIETASALAYLHASEIIHRDVKTNNILLDNNFCVKVADFGLSRLFPIDVTHVSTAPQGTPGYVDPDYHQCYQLTNKSDVYSFGVVLIELISSMPAVDISRHRHEINLASYAIHKIQKCAFDELIDPCLGYQSDEEVRRMTTSIAELAFRCLQQDKEMRPTMEEVFEELQRIQSGEHKLESENIEEQHHKNSAMSQSSVVKQQPPTSPECDEVSLLENAKLPPASPISVTDKWISTQTTPNASS